MSWICESNLTWFQRFAVQLLRCGPIPKHIAFIMDGNRRYASKNNLKTKTDGHLKGFTKLVEILQWCLEIGVKEVTAFAFSIDNFKRSKDEVDTLMQLAKEKFLKLIEDREMLEERGICVRIVGNLSLLPVDLQRIIAEIMLMTKANDRAVWNIAFAYSSRDEMTESVKTIVNGVHRLELDAHDINEDLFKQCMYMNNSPDPDLIIRTSGETRLSDFLTYQCSTTLIYCGKMLWPELNMWQLLGVIFHYQQYKFRFIDARQCLDSYVDNTRTNKKRVESFIERNEKRRTKYLEDLLKTTQTFRCNNVRSTGFK
ncbi:Dehydrodolichyl diphosphate synthase complex subunit DHDDS, partial [Pseudolycoriella hygida]